jgi:ribonucleotide monophosphatase NagD (HAD superfamily)
MVRGVLIDLDGVVYVGNRALPGSLEAIRRIRESGIPFKFITNTTRRPRRRIVSDLARLGLSIVAEDLFTPAALARDFLARQNLVPLLIVHPDLHEDFIGFATDGGEAVVVGDAGAFFTMIASGKVATVLGKPAPAFFKIAVESMVSGAEDVAMIGDDAEADVGGAMAAGLQGILVQTGKYRPGQEMNLPERPTHVVQSLGAAIELLLS